MELGDSHLRVPFSLMIKIQTIWSKEYYKGVRHAGVTKVVALAFLTRKDEGKTLSKKWVFTLVLLEIKSPIFIL